MITSGLTLSLDLLRNTYTLTVNRNNTTYIAAVSGGGTYRWGQVVNITATVSSTGKFTNWTTSSGGSFGDANSASTTYTMPTNNATIKANGEVNGIHFDVNGGTEIRALSDVSPTSSLLLPVPDYKRDGYGFAGWNTNANGTGTNYGPNETIDASGMAGATLYAHWIASAGNIQNWTGCSSLTAATYDSGTGKITATAKTVTALKDTRDNNVYAVARLADGNCWMIENLRLGSGTYSTGSQNNPVTVQATTNSFTTNDYVAQQMNATNTITNATGRTKDSRYLYGNYYSWAQTINSASVVTSGSVSTSICPAGWKLPVGGSTANNRTNPTYGYLDTVMGGTGEYQSSTAGTKQSAKWRSYPNNVSLSGYWGRTSAYSQGTKAQYWSATAYYSDSGTASHAYSLDLGDSLLSPGATWSLKWGGSPVRCVIGS